MKWFLTRLGRAPAWLLPPEHDWDTYLQPIEEILAEPDELWMSVEDWIRERDAVLAPFYGGDK